MATQFKMPQLGETVVEGTVTRWLKTEGDTVEADEPLVEVSTDKVDSEIPAPVSGVISKILAQEGDTIEVGAVLAEISDGAGSEQPAPEAKEQPQEPPSQAEPSPPAKEPAEPPAKRETQEPAAEAAKPASAEEPAAQAAQLEATDDEPRRGILSPLVRKLAGEHGIDLSQVKGSGTGGRITKQDVMGYVEAGGADRKVAVGEQARPAAQAQPRPQPQAPREPGSGDEVVQVSNMRRSIAEHMVAQIHETARAWNTVEVDFTHIGNLRRKAGPAFKQKEGFSLTWMPFLCKAVTQVLLRYPNVNSTWNGDGTMTRKHYVNLGIAVALENGLIVPVIKGADGMNIVGLGRAVRDVATRARNKKLVPDDVQGGTFTITNPGPFGSVLSVPIINKGQAGILAFDAVVKRPVVVTDEYGNDSIAIREMVYLSMSWDHRIIDGAEAAVFLRDLKEILESSDFSSDLSAYLPEE